MQEETKLTIKDIVLGYAQMFPDEYNAVIKQISEVRKQQMNDLATGTEEGIIEQKLYEIPETLYAMFKTGLTSKQYSDFYAKEPKQAKKNARWFARTFYQFAIAKKI